MEIDVSEALVRIVNLRLSGRIDAFVAPKFRESIDSELARGGRFFVCDLLDVDFLDSAGLAVLVSLLKRSRQSGGDVKLVMPASATAQRILHLTKFDRVFTIIERPTDVARCFVH